MMIDFFNNCRFWGRNRSSCFCEKLRVYTCLNLCLDAMANMLVPMWLNKIKKNAKYRLLSRENTCSKVIVSLTSFPARLPYVWLVVECLLRQTVKPDVIVLYLSKEQVSDMTKVPKKLIEQQGRGLKICLCEDDLRIHKKYYYAFQEYPNDIVITVDDDLFYPSDFIENLLMAHQEHPDCIIANWTKNMRPGTSKYGEWPDAEVGLKKTGQIVIGCEGVLYPCPSRCMHEDVCKAEIFKEHCFLADDIWLSCMALLKNTPIYHPAYQMNHLPIWIKGNVTLLSSNRTGNQVQIDNLNAYYKDKIGIQPFVDLNK